MTAAARNLIKLRHGSAPQRKAATVTKPDARALTADAARYLAETIGGDRPWDNLGAWILPVAKAVRRTSNRQHAQALAIAYATSVSLAASPDREAVLQRLETTLGRKRSRRTRDLHLVLEAFVTYGAETAAEHLPARKLLSRDVRAVEHLRDRQIPPSRVVELARLPGEGVDRWSRRAAAERPAIKPAPPARTSPREAEERAWRHEVVHNIHRPDGIRYRHARICFTGFTAREVEVAMKRLVTMSAEH